MEIFRLLRETTLQVQTENEQPDFFAARLLVVIDAPECSPDAKPEVWAPSCQHIRAGHFSRYRKV